MSSKLEGGLWQGFIIPEHRKALWDLQNEQQLQKRPALDEQEWEIISGKLQQSMVEREAVMVLIFDLF